jgi:hypothetical protein
VEEVLQIGLAEASRAGAGAGEGDRQRRGLVDGDAVGLLEGLAVLEGAGNRAELVSQKGRPAEIPEFVIQVMVMLSGTDYGSVCEIAR